jgi:hypothetical protein
MSDKLTEEEYLKRHLESLESKPEQKNEQKSDFVDTRFDNLEYFAFDVKEFPCGQFYPAGTMIQVRAASVKEIQGYSMVDDSNFYDIVEKMNEMLSSCVRVKYLDGKIGSFLDIKDPDRYYLIFLIREITFQKGASLTTTATCPDGRELKIELKRVNFVFHTNDEKLSRWFDQSNRCYTFKAKNNKVFRLAPPTIGLQKGFTEYIVKETTEKRKLNLSFLKIIPFTLFDRNSITKEGIVAKLKEFEELDDMSFQFLNSAVEKMTFGIKELKSACQCGEEIRTDMVFPNGASAIFVIHDAFDQFIEE